jgi:Txe/YoeB family toxin of Txe-Axe toxin-antitoxin module
MGILSRLFGKRDPDVSKAVENPKLLKALQAWHKHDNDRNINKVLREIKRATFLIPAKFDELRGEPTGAPNTIRLTKDAGFQMPSVDAGRGRKLLPIFTDWENLWAHYPDDTVKSFLAPFYQLSQWVSKARMGGAVINPAENHFILSSELITKIEKEV